MPTFITDEEFTQFATAGDVTAVADKADAFIQTLRVNLETVKAEADAAAITAEQTCSVLEEKFLSLSSEFSAVESRNSLLESDLQRHGSELALARSEKHQIHLSLIEKENDIERLQTEVSELQKSKRQLVEIVGVKDTEISEKNSTIRSYLDKISDLTDRAAQRDANVDELQAELRRCKANSDKLSQEKELIEKHNAWLNEELNTKVDSLLEHRRRSAEIEADLSAKLADLEKQYNESSSSLNWHKERVRELESKLDSLHQELCSARDDASAAEQRYSAEISTVSKLVDLYKESSEEWSKKAGELEGVIKALETQLSQVESDYNARLDQEVSGRKEAEKESSELREKLAKCEAELESSRRASELDILPLSGFTTKALALTSGTNDDSRDDCSTVPHVPAGVSGTALAASLLREGWSLAKMYGKYQEAADAWRHEQMGRKQTEAILERVLLEIEEKASVILDERAEHERMAEAYTLMDEKLQQSLSEQANLEKIIRELKAEMKRYERETNIAKKETIDLQKQVTILLKECRDIQLRCGSMNTDCTDDDFGDSLTVVDDESDAQKVISEHLLSIKDIKGLVEQNAKLRSLARSLSDEVENGERQLKIQFEEELQKHKEEAASRVAAVLDRAEEQGRMIESLHSSVSMYRRLYEEEHRLRSSQLQTAVAPTADRGKDSFLRLEASEEAIKRVQEQASERVRCLEDELASLKTEIISLRSERDKLSMEANYAQEKLQRFMKEFDHQREESNGVLVRNLEFTNLIVDYQKKLREGSDYLKAAEDHSRKLNMELSVLKREKELLENSEKRALGEVQELSQRVYRLQATLNTIQGAEQDREEAKVAERTKQDEHIKQIEREWAEAKRELLEERNNVRSLSLEHKHAMKDALRQIEDKGKELAAAQHALAAAETKIAEAEARYADLEKQLTSTGERDSVPMSASPSGGEATGDLRTAKQEIERLKAESLASKDHMLQYKSIAEVNEAALKQMEAAHASFRNEAEQLKKSLEAEIQSLMDRVQELEKESILKSKEAASIATQKDEELASALAQIASLKEENSNKVSQIMAMEVQVGLLKEDLVTAQQRAQTVQTNYERQVILQSETIQELTKTSQVLAAVQDEVSALRKTVDGYKSENAELKAKWGSEKSELEKSKSDAEKKYAELNEQNKLLHSQLEALHIKLVEKDHTATGLALTSGSDDTHGESGLLGVVSYLRRSREIAETEISLLKQEKLRLQSQLERVLKAAEAAETSLSAERANSRNFLFNEDEFKALKLQVSEMNLLRESNMQLREENRHNFEECLKLREVAQIAKTEAEKLQSTLKEREFEFECLVKEIEQHKKEKVHLESRISDMLEASKNVDLEEYDRLKNEVEQLRASIREKEAAIEESTKLVSQKQDLVEKLEQDLASIRSERDNLIRQVEVLKSDLDKQRKFVITCKRLSREKEALVKEKESLFKERVSMEKERDSLIKEKEVLLREKEESGREKQAILKQFEDLRHEKKAAADPSGDPAMREKEKEKDARMQILESTLGRLREENKKEKESRRNIEKVIQAKAKNVDLERKKFEGEHEKYKEAVRKISEELEKLKHAKDSLPEGTAVVQLLSGSNLDGLASAYVLAVENFEREAQLVFNDVGNQGSLSSSAMDATPVAATTTQAPPAEVPTTVLSVAPPISQPGKASEEREKKISLPKSNVETRKSVRRFVRPQFQSEKPQRDVEMSDLDGSKNVEKPSTVHEKAKQISVRASSEPSIRKRPASPSPSELQEEPFQPGDSSTVFPEPSLKKSKGFDSVPEHVQAQSAVLENVEITPSVEELLDAVADVPQGLCEETFDFQGLGTESGETQQPNDAAVDAQKDNVVDQEHACKATDTELLLDEASYLLAEQGVQPVIDAGDREEGEMFPESSDVEAGDDTTTRKIQDASDLQPDHSKMPSPARINEGTVATFTADVNETNSPEVSNSNEQMEEGELPEEGADDSDKSNGEDDQTAGDTDPTSEAVSGTTEGNISTVESAVSKDDSSDITGQDAGQSTHGKSKILNLNENAKKKRAERLGQSPATSVSPVPERRRGRGGPLSRNRGGRLSRGGHRQTPSNQG